MFQNQIRFIIKHRSEIIFWLLLIPVSFFVFSFHTLNFDDGVILNMAWQMNSGKILYHDFFEYIPPGSSYLINLFWTLLNSTSYIIPIVISWFFWLISAIFLYILSKKITSNKIIALSIIIVWLLACIPSVKINHNFHSSCTSIIVLYFLYEFTKTQQKIYILLSSILAAFTTLFLHTKGLSILVASIIVIYLFSTKHKIVNVLQFFLLYLISNIILFSPWEVTAIAQNLIIFPLEAKYIQTSFYIPETIISQTCIFILMLIFSIYKNKPQYWLLFIFQVFLFASYSYNINSGHLALNIFPFIIFYFLTIKDTLNIKKISITKTNLIIKLTFVISIIVSSYKLINSDINNNILFTDVLKYKQPIEIVGYNIPQAEHIYAGPFLPNAYYELNKPNPFIYTHNMLYCLDECQAKTLEILKEVKPEYAIMNYWYAPPAYNENNPVDNYIKNNYVYCEHTRQHLDIYARYGCE